MNIVRHSRVFPSVFWIDTRRETARCKFENDPTVEYKNPPSAGFHWLLMKYLEFLRFIAAVFF